MVRRERDAVDKIRDLIIITIGILFVIFLVGEICPILLNASTNPEGQNALNVACGNVLKYYPDFLKLENLIR